MQPAMQGLEWLQVQQWSERPGHSTCLTNPVACTARSLAQVAAFTRALGAAWLLPLLDLFVRVQVRAGGVWVQAQSWLVLP